MDEGNSTKNVERPITRLVLRVPSPRSFLGKLALAGMLFTASGIVIAALVLVIAYWKYAPDLPKLPTIEEYLPPITSEIWTADRVLGAEFYDERRKVIPYQQIPKKLIQAFVAAEDERFFDHPGVDPIGTLRAVFKTYVLQGRVQGGSSLTQQTAKGLLVSTELSKISEEDLRLLVRDRLLAQGLENDPEAIRTETLKVHAQLRAQAHARATQKTLRRKFREMILAFRLEKALTKEQILYLYLNNVYLGHHSYGIQSAAENYFRKDIKNLTLGEMAMLAGLPKAPSRFSPYARPKTARNRRNYVLNRMLEENMISRTEWQAATNEKVYAYPMEDVFREFAPFYTEQVRRDLVNRYGNERLLKDGLKVYMAMNSENQKSAQSAMLNGLIRVDKRQGYTGPLRHLTTKKERVEFRKKIASVLRKEKLTPGKYYVGIVKSIDATQNYATIDIGGQAGKLPITGMRWARKPNSEQYYPSALINHVKKALSPGDVIVVKCVEKAILKKGQENRFSKLIPETGPYLTLEQEPTLQGAIISVNPHRKYLVAMIGGYDFDASEYNRAMQACRQPGSSFKPIIYSGAIEKLGWSVNHILVDSPVVFRDSNRNWKPENYGSNFKGDVLLRSALINSMNIPAIKTLDALGIPQAASWAHQLGISTPINEDLSMALGGSCVRINDLVNVYATINQGGTQFKPFILRKVEDRFGRTLEDHTAFDDEYATWEERIIGGYAKLLEKPRRVMKPETAYLITHLLREVVLYGTGVGAQQLGKPAAGKTGTTNDCFDTWFTGFTRDLVTSVWLGYDKYEHPLGKFETGGRASLPIWVDYMKNALADRPQSEFSVPEDADIVWARIDPDTGKLARPSAQRSVLAPFVRDSEPKEMAPEPGKIDSRDFGYYEPL